MPGTELGTEKIVIDQTGIEPVHMIFLEHKYDSFKILQ